MLADSLAGLPAFLAYFASGALLLGIFAFIYLWITPHSELPLIRQGNVAAAVGLAGALAGYTLPLASAIAHSVGILDMLLWAGVGLVVQVLVLVVVRRSMPNLFGEIQRGNIATAILLAGVSVTAGVINAASMTY